MFTLFLFGWLLLLFGYFSIRLRLHAKLQQRLVYERYMIFYKWENWAVIAILAVMTVCFCFNTIRLTPPGLSKWWSVLILLIVALVTEAVCYDKITKHLWETLKEPFRKVDKRDLKWRIRSRLVHTKVILEIHYPATWVFFRKVGSFIKSKRKVA